MKDSVGNFLFPTLKDLSDESVLFQAWKKTSAYIRSHNWYADTLELDWQSLRVPTLIKEIQTQLAEGTWTPARLLMVPAPKSQEWVTTRHVWHPKAKGGARTTAVKIRPLAHVAIIDQVLATAVSLCLADRVETLQGNPARGLKTIEDRKRILSYGNRLFCDVLDENLLFHRWGSRKLYRGFSSDYARFLSRPELVARGVDLGENTEVAIVTADLSRFYDRVRPWLLSERLQALQQSEEETAFFELAGRLLDWKWQDEKRASAYEEDARKQNAPFDTFQNIALPQGLVASGFLSNVVLLPFDRAMADGMGQAISAAPKSQFILQDACRYVDDIRLVLAVPKGASEQEIEEAVVAWLSSIIDSPRTGLQIERSKVRAVVRGRETGRFIVPQSKAASRIQSEISGGFDAGQGAQIIDAIEGFFNAQRRFPSAENGAAGDLGATLHGVADMRDDTAARFAAARFRKTFRSLRPLLEAEAGQTASIFEAGSDDDNDSGAAGELLINRQQLDERGHIFALGLIEAWQENPAHVRLLRIALDLCPSPKLLTPILTRLAPAWKGTSIRGGRREVMLYCLAELFRAGATETGIVNDAVMLPSLHDVTNYHGRLTEEALAIVSRADTSIGFSRRIPWYLIQQVVLYLATRPMDSEAWQQVERAIRRKTILKRYRELARFLSGRYPRSVADNARLLILVEKSFGNRGPLEKFVRNGWVDEMLLRALGDISPAFAEMVWGLLDGTQKHDLKATGVALRLGRSGTSDQFGVCVAANLVGRAINPFHEEENLVQFTNDLIAARKENPRGILTPWRVTCEVTDRKHGPIGIKIQPGTVRIIDAPGGEAYFALPPWCDSEEKQVRVEIGQVLRYLLTGALEYTRPVSNPRLALNLPRYRPASSHWETGRYATFNGRSAFGPDWLPISSWVESLMFNLLRWPGCDVLNAAPSLQHIVDDVEKRLRDLIQIRGQATGTLFLEQEAPLPSKPSQRKARGLRIAIAQSVLPTDTDYALAGSIGLQMNNPAFRSRHQAHLRALLQGIRQMLRVRLTHDHAGEPGKRNLDWLILPELAVHPDDVVPHLIPFVRDFRAIVLVGLVYHPRDPSPGAPLINSALWLIPEWTPDHGLQIRRIEQGKGNLAPGESALVGASVEGFRPAQWIVRYRWHPDPQCPPLLLSASVCYDATDLALAADLRDRNDLYAIPALNLDVRTFDNMAASLHYHTYQGVLVVNNGKYGGSSFFAPLNRDHCREIFHFHGQPQASIGFAEIDPAKMIIRPSGAETAAPRGTWKEPPAGWVGPHAGSVAPTA